MVAISHQTSIDKITDDHLWTVIMIRKLYKNMTHHKKCSTVAPAVKGWKKTQPRAAVLHKKTTAEGGYATSQALRGAVANPLDGATAGAIPARSAADAVLQDGEIIILTVKPNGAFVLLRSWPVLLLCAAGLVGLTLAEIFTGPMSQSARQMVLLGCAIAAGLQIAAAALRWLGCLYVLTNRRVLHIQGLVRMDTSTCNLGDIAHISITHSPLERPLCLGSLVFLGPAKKSAPAKNFPPQPGCLVAGPWVNISRPYEIAAEIRKAISQTPPRQTE